MVWRRISRLECSCFFLHIKGWSTRLPFVTFHPAFAQLSWRGIYECILCEPGDFCNGCDTFTRPNGKNFLSISVSACRCASSPSIGKGVLTTRNRLGKGPGPLSQPVFEASVPKSLHGLHSTRGFSCIFTVDLPTCRCVSVLAYVTHSRFVISPDHFTHHSDRSVFIHMGEDVCFPHLGYLQIIVFPINIINDCQFWMILGSTTKRTPVFVRVEVIDKFREAEVSNAGSTRIADCESCAAGMEALSPNWKLEQLETHWNECQLAARGLWWWITICWREKYDKTGRAKQPNFPIFLPVASTTI